MKQIIFLFLTITIGFAQEQPKPANHCVVEKSKTTKNKPAASKNETYSCLIINVVEFLIK
jgi:hypothetical protein